LLFSVNCVMWFDSCVLGYLFFSGWPRHWSFEVWTWAFALGSALEPFGPPRFDFQHLDASVFVGFWCLNWIWNLYMWLALHAGGWLVAWVV